MLDIPFPKPFSPREDIPEPTTEELADAIAIRLASTSGTRTPAAEEAVYTALYEALRERPDLTELLGPILIGNPY